MRKENEELERRLVSGIMLTLLLLGILSLALNIKPVNASYVIFIRSDGSVQPSTAPIQRDGNVYTFTSNIYDCYGVRVQKDDVIVDGNGYTLDGIGQLRGFDLGDAKNTTVKNVFITQFEYGVYLSSISGYTLIGNTITNNLLDGVFMYVADDNFVCNNTITNNGRYGINVGDTSTGNNIIGNTIANNAGDGLVIFHGSNGNTIYHNNLVDNTYNVVFYGDTTNVWDNGYPSGGNYWSDFHGAEADTRSGPNQDQVGSDGIVDQAKPMTAGNVDHYPLNSPFPQTPDFDILVSPSTQTTDQGSTLTTYVYLSTIGGYNCLVSLSASGQPEGVSIDFNPNTGTPYFISTVTLQIGYSVPVNTYSITLTGLGSDGKTRSTTYLLTVTSGAVPEFPLSFTIEISLILPIIYIWLKNKHRTQNGREAT